MYNFEDIKGNVQIIKNLRNAIIKQKISHAYIFDGEKGLGKKTISKTFAKTLLCLENKDTPCNKCSSCIKFDVDNNPDIIYIKSDKKSISIETIRDEINNEVIIRPYQYRYKIFIIEDADTMTIQAQNALLKTIEEPPKYAIFLLLSNNYNNFLVTILSRCIILKLKPVGFETTKQYLLENNDISEDKAYTLALYSQGNIGKAIEFSKSEEFITMREDIIKITLDLDHVDLMGIYKMIPIFEQYKENIQQCLDIMYIIYRDCAVLKDQNDNYNIIQKDKIDTIIKISEVNILSSLIKKAEIIFNAKRQLKLNANFQMVIEVMLLKIKGS